MFGRECQKDNGLGNRYFVQDALPKCKECFPSFYHDVVVNDEIIFSNANQLSRFKGKDILIVGGGGSSDGYLRNNDLSLFDSIWSLNAFYLHPILQNTHVDVISLGPTDMPYPLDSPLFDYLKKFQVFVGFELHYKWTTGPRKEEICNYINNTFVAFSSALFFFQTKWYSMLGGGVRLVVLASSLGAKSVSFIGFDGVEAAMAGHHAFEPGKSSLPSRSKLYQNPKKEYKREYDLFWTYTQKTFPLTSFISLDKENEYHSVLAS